MQLALVVRQLCAVLDRVLLRETRREGLTVDDALVMAWLIEDNGIGASFLGERVGRSRQSVQRTLERLERRGLVQRYKSLVRNRAEGWGLTEAGQKAWQILSSAFRIRDRQLEARDIDLRRWIINLEVLLQDVSRFSRSTWKPEVGLVVPPEQEQDRLDWDH